MTNNFRKDCTFMVIGIVIVVVIIISNFAGYEDTTKSFAFTNYLVAIFVEAMTLGVVVAWIK